MQLDQDVCYRALQARDARFDGRFFVAVRSTGIYCRPVCPARTPRRENCLFVACAAAAQEAGFRPCLRCRPEASPGTPAWLGTSASVSRALRLIGDGALDSGSVDELATRVGMGGRHLRRLFLEHLGASPISIAQTRRVAFAKKLLDETELSMAEIAYSSGFSSVRRFNDAVRRAYDRTPTELRRRAPARPDAGLTLQLPYRPPYPWRSVLGFLAARATPGVEGVAGDRYWRTFRRGESQGWIEVTPQARGHGLRVRIRHSGPLLLIQLVEQLRALFDLTADPREIATQLRRDPRLRAVLRAIPGVRVPGAWEGFELAVRAILGQQVSVAAATTLAGRLARAVGEDLPQDLQAAPGQPGPRLIFPDAAAVASADLSRIGLTGARIRAIRALAEAVAAGELRLAPSPDPQATIEQLLALPGVGPWTASYIAMRALREPDAFPTTDLGLLRALAISPAELADAAEAWRPWRAYAAMLLWQGSTQRAAA
jgi:AraC family transcriptional regulator of adaptative response / DNA-3-methyladenine glycosylase II